MKNLFIVVLAALTLPLVGCKYENSSPEMPYIADLWSEVRTGSETIRTENEWAPVDGIPRKVKSTQTRNGVTVHEDTGFKYGWSRNPLVPTEFVRTIYSPTRATERHTATYADDRNVQTAAEIFRDGEASPSQWMKRELDSSDRVIKEESGDNGVHTLLTDYEYGTMDVEYRSAVTTNGVTVNTRVQELYANNERTSIVQREVFSGENRIEVEFWGADGAYKKYVGENITETGGDMSGETLVTERSERTYNTDGNTEVQTSTLKEYDPQTGALVKESTIRNCLELRFYDL